MQGISKAYASCQDISTCKSAHSLSNRTDHNGVTTMKRLDQGHLHPKLEVPVLTCPGQESNPASSVGGEYSRKEPFKQLTFFRTSTNDHATSGECSRHGSPDVTVTVATVHVLFEHA